MKTSPSSLARELACPSSVLLPAIGRVSIPAMRGTAIHDFLRSVGLGLGRDLAATKIPEEWRETVLAIEIPAGLDPKLGVPEIALAWNIETGETRELARGGELTREEIRALARDGEMVGTVDWLCLDEAAVHVRDWKSGWSAVDKAEVNNQLAAYAVMAAKHFGRDRAHVSITRLLDDGSSFSAVATLDALDLDAAEAKIRTHARQMADRERLFQATGVLPRLVEGSHCKFCPGFKSCPAKGQLVRAVFEKDGETPRFLAGMPVPLDAESAGELWVKIGLAEDLLKTLKQAVKEFAEREPLNLPNGKILAEVEKSTSRIVPDRLKAFLADDTAFFDEIVERKESVTKKAVTSALKKRLGQGEKITHLERRFYDGLEKVGGLKHSSYRAVEEVDADSKKLTANTMTVQTEEPGYPQPGSSVGSGVLVTAGDVKRPPTSTQERK